MSNIIKGNDGTTWKVTKYVESKTAKQINKAWKDAQKRLDKDYEEYIISQLFSDNPEVFFLW